MLKFHRSLLFVLLAGTIVGIAAFGSALSAQEAPVEEFAAGSSSSDITASLPAAETHINSSAALDPVDAASRVDSFLSREAHLQGEPAVLTDDATFLRRVHLDLVGEAPTPDEVMDFVLDTDEAKREDVVAQLLGSAKFGQNWARYWRDVILYRQSDPRGNIAEQSLIRYLEDQFNEGASWRQVAKDFITATGNVRENGETAFYMAHFGNGEEVAAEFSRVFLGIQIQCAQCHDHPTDRWKREQFHELAAFLPRVQVRAVQNDSGPRTFQVQSRENLGRRGRNQQANRRPARGPEHYMSDLEDPSSRGTLMRPRFFVNSKVIPEGQSDERRRNALAAMMTSKENPWFAKAFVNRVWAEMLGEGFYEPIDDLGPDRQCSAPETMDFLCEQFIAADYNVKWLYETIANTDAYQRVSRARRDYTEDAFAANCPQRLRGDQLYDILTEVLGGSNVGAARGRGNQRGRQNQRTAFNTTFGYDPSVPRDEVTGSIPQALYMMNSQPITAGTQAARPGSALAQILREFPKNDEAVTELYLRCLARVPSKDELQTCRDYLAGIDSRAEGIEDIFWVLINTAEFLHRN